MSNWVEACGADDIDEEDVIRFDHGGRTFAIYRSPDDRFFATDGFCTHEQVHLADGLVMDDDHRMSEAQWPLQLPDRRSQGRAGLRQPQDVSGEGRCRQSLHRDRLTWTRGGRHGHHRRRRMRRARRARACASIGYRGTGDAGRRRAAPPLRAAAAVEGRACAERRAAAEMGVDAREVSSRSASPASPARARWRSTARPRLFGFPTACRCPTTSCCWRRAPCRAGCALAEQAGERIAYLRTFADALRIRAHL